VAPVFWPTLYVPEATTTRVDRWWNVPDGCCPLCGRVVVTNDRVISVCSVVCHPVAIAIVTDVWWTNTNTAVTSIIHFYLHSIYIDDLHRSLSWWQVSYGAASVMRRFRGTRPHRPHTPPIPAVSSCQSPCRGITAPTPTNNVSVLSAFSWRCHEAHHCAKSATQASSRWRRHEKSSGRELACSCVSSLVSVELEQYTVPIDNISDIFSVRTKAKLPEHRSLCYRYVNWKRTCCLVSMHKSMHKNHWSMI